MKIALCQFHIEWENKSVNFMRAEKFIKQASDSECDFIAFPEMSFTGFSMNVEKTTDSFSETIEKISRFAKQYKISIGFGWVGMGQKKAQNHYSVVDADGTILSDYVKIHPFSYSGEDQYFEPGDTLSLFQMSKMCVSTFICYDLRFPEIFQSVSKSADLILVAANWPSSRREHWRCLIRARALENQVYLAAVNCVGNENGVEYSGDSCIINPNGDVLEELVRKEGLVMIELPKDVEKFRSDFPMKNDRKVEFYRKIL